MVIQSWRNGGGIIREVFIVCWDYGIFRDSEWMRELIVTDGDRGCVSLRGIGWSGGVTKHCVGLEVN